ncbi:MAG TPA: hypothetical protein ENJ38_12650 [Rhodospirillales bacterium]|nr:hypothetical protein [Rhodospirillales bacterium]
MEPLERVSALLALMRELKAVLERENALLRSMGVEELRALQEEKLALADAYEVEVRRLRRSPDFIGSLEPEARELLAEATRELQATMRTNVSALAAAKLVVERVARHLAEVLGPGHGRPAGGAAEVVPLTLDRQV